LGRYPHIKEFVDKHANEFPNFSVEYAQGMDPTLKMVDDKDNTETQEINSWKTENLVEFLSEKLIG